MSETKDDLLYEAWGVIANAAHAPTNWRINGTTDHLTPLEREWVEAAERWRDKCQAVAPTPLCWKARAEKAEADALVLIANNETLQREAKDAWRRVDEYARIVQRVVVVCEDKYVGPPTEYGQGFQEGYNDALGVVQAALNAAT